MEQDFSLVLSSYARSRMSARGLNEAHVQYCCLNKRKTYKVGGNVVWEAKLPDGRNIKVRVKDVSANPIIVVDVFTYK
jgi:hypothetical protein